ncbi:MAG: hypothetical protein ACTSUE_03080, partial [Promethearchaeota archaeon]
MKLLLLKKITFSFFIILGLLLSPAFSMLLKVNIKNNQSEIDIYGTSDPAILYDYVGQEEPVKSDTNEENQLSVMEYNTSNISDFGEIEEIIIDNDPPYIKLYANFGKIKCRGPVQGYAIVFTVNVDGQQGSQRYDWSNFFMEEKEGPDFNFFIGGSV